MFKYIHKISPYLDESRADLVLNKRSRNYRFKNKVLYIKDQTVLLKERKNRYWKHYFINIFYRKYDKPAIIYESGAQSWYKNGNVHRDNDKPAYIGLLNKSWYCNGKIHRDDDKPAFICKNGVKQWYKNGVYYFPEIRS